MPKEERAIGIGARLIDEDRGSESAACFENAVAWDIIDGDGAVYLRVEDYQTVEFPNGTDPDKLAPIRAAIEGTS